MSTVLDEIFQEQDQDDYTYQEDEPICHSNFSSHGTNFQEFIDKIEKHCKEIQRCRNNNLHESLRLHHSVIDDFQFFLKVHISSTVQECIKVARIMCQIAPHFLNQLIPVFYSKINYFDVPHFVEVFSLYCNGRVLDYDFFQSLSSKICDNIRFLSAKQILEICNSIQASNFKNKSFCRALLLQSNKIMQQKCPNRNLKKQRNRILEEVITVLKKF